MRSSLCAYSLARLRFDWKGYKIFFLFSHRRWEIERSGGRRRLEGSGDDDIRMFRVYDGCGLVEMEYFCLHIVTETPYNFLPVNVVRAGAETSKKNSLPAASR